MTGKIGFIGCGNMAKYIISGMLTSGKFESEDIVVFDINAIQVKELNVNKVDKCEDVFSLCEIVILSVKPNYTKKILIDMYDYINESHVIISIAAGVSILSLESVSNKSTKIIRVMPNSPASVLLGCSSITPNKNVSEEDLRETLKIFDSVGITSVFNEEQIHAVTGISGSSPAYVFMFIEALADAGVLGGVPRDIAYKFAAQSVMGAAKMVLESNIHPAELKDKVCSPGGTTIEAVRVLEDRKMRSSIIEAVVSCIEKSIILSKN